MANLTCDLSNDNGGRVFTPLGSGDGCRRLQRKSHNSRITQRHAAIITFPATTLVAIAGPSLRRALALTSNGRNI